MALTSYLDESGTHAGSDTIVVAGFLSTPRRWELFELAWRQILNKHGIAFFHMTDFAASREQFEGWDESKRRDCLGGLLEVINHHVIGSVGIVINMSDYHALVSPEAAKYAGGPYGFAASSCMMLFSRVMEATGVLGKIAYVFESGAEGHGQVAEAFNNTLSNPSNREYFHLLSIKFEPKQDFVPLQAADILAYELYQHLPTHLGNSSRPTRYPLRALSQTPHDWGQVDPQSLALMAHTIEIRLKLSKDELWKDPPFPARTSRVPSLISIETMQEKWEWMNKLTRQFTR